MLEAMYGIEFVSAYDAGYGVVIFETGRIYGGDSSFVYIGSYHFDNGLLKATVKVTNDRHLLQSIVGLDQFTVTAEANLGSNATSTEFIMRGEVLENPALKVAVKFTRRAELP